MFLHASHVANNGASSVVVKSLDTDVAVIGLWVASKLPCDFSFRLVQVNTPGASASASFPSLWAQRFVKHSQASTPSQGATQ